MTRVVASATRVGQWACARFSIEAHIVSIFLAYEYCKIQLCIIIEMRYLQADMHMVANKSATIIGLPLDTK